MNMGRIGIAIVAIEVAVASYMSVNAGAIVPPASTRRVAIDSTRTIWDSVFTAEQAVRGEALYRSNCQSCHAPELTGAEDALPLTGDSFMANWNGLTMKDLFDKIRNSMPPDTPGSLDAQQTADVLTHILNFNKFPAGSAELPGDPDKLSLVVFKAKKG